MSASKEKVVALDIERQRATGGLFFDRSYLTEPPHRLTLHRKIAERDVTRGCLDAN